MFQERLRSELLRIVNGDLRPHIPPIQVTYFSRPPSPLTTAETTGISGLDYSYRKVKKGFSFKKWSANPILFSTPFQLSWPIFPTEYP